MLSVMVCLAAALWAEVSLGADESSDQTATGSIAGRVINPEKTPLAGAHVELWRCDIPTREYSRAKGTAELLTNGTGEFRIGDLQAGHYVVVVHADGLATARIATIVLAGQQQHFEIEMRPEAHWIIRLQTEAGGAVVGATLRDLQYRDMNGEFFLLTSSPEKLTLFGLNAEPSGADGVMRLPDLPDGATVTAAVFDHPDWAPLKISDVKVTGGQIVAGTMRPGVKLTLKMLPAEDGTTLSHATLRMVHQDSSNPSTRVDVPIDFTDGATSLMVEPGKYSLVHVKHDLDVITPIYFPTKEHDLEISVGKNDTLEFMLHKKVEVRGKVKMVGTGKAAAKISVIAEMPNQPVCDWYYVAGTNSDMDGKYVLQVPAGAVRLFVQSDEVVMVKPFVDVDVKADASTVLPDLEVLAIPTISGRVIDPSGNPVPGAVVRLQGLFRHFRQPPTATGADGRFELKITQMPEDLDIRAPQLLDVMHPTKPLSARTEIRFDEPKSCTNMAIKLKAERYDDFLARALTPVNDSEREFLADREDRWRAMESLIGQPAPELDGVLWLNTDKPTMSLADFRGKYVLLDFWAVWCGPCHADFPDVKLLNETYKDKGLVVIGVHDNSVDPGSVRKHVEEQKLTFPIVIDQRDGRTVEAYQKIGAMTGYPNYVLIGPDGTIVQTTKIANYKFEFVRKYLFGGRKEGP